MEKINKVRVFKLPDFTSYHKTVVIKKVVFVYEQIYIAKKKKKQDRDPRYIATCIQSTDFCQRYSHELVKNLEYNKW